MMVVVTVKDIVGMVFFGIVILLTVIMVITNRGNKKK